MRSTTRKHESGSTKRGVPDNYTGTNASLCNAATKSGKPCRALKLRGGRCKWHGGLSTGPRTAEGKARCTMNLPWAKTREMVCNANVPPCARMRANESAGDLPSSTRGRGRVCRRS
jgi:hypothetical protein